MICKRKNPWDQEHCPVVSITGIHEVTCSPRKESPSRDLNTGPADYKSAALPTKPLRRHMILSVDSKKGGAPISLLNKNGVLSLAFQEIISFCPVPAQDYPNRLYV
jgi:hypothetical protein